MSDREGGFIVLHRRLRSSPMWCSMTALQQRVWLEMLLEANWRPSEVVVAEGRVVIHRGEFVTTQETLADQAKVSRKVVRQTYAQLLAEGAIRQRQIGTGMGSRRGRRVVAVTIVNFSKYQERPVEEGRTGAAEGPHQNKGTREQGRSHRSRRSTVLPSVDPGAGQEEGLARVVKLNPDDILTVWDPVTETHVRKGLTARGREQLRRGRA